LPFLSVLAPSERYAQERGKPHKKLTDWARQMLLLVRRWWPEREIVAVADSGYARIRLLAACPDASCPNRSPSSRACARTRRSTSRPRRASRNRDRQTAPQRQALAHLGRGGGRSEHHLDAHRARRLVRQRGAHCRGGLGYGALVAHRATAGAPALGPDSRPSRRVRAASPTVHRPRRGTRADLGLVRLALEDGGDLPRSAAAPWDRDAATVVRASHSADDPRAFGLFSIVTLYAHQRMVQQGSGALLRQAGWYRKSHPTFSDALALVRRELWAERTFCRSESEADMVKVPRAFVERLTETLCYAA
jgi:hypothetical protein